MWGMGGGIGGWTGADDGASMVVLQAAVDAGVTFFDSAQVYGSGTSDRLMGELRAANPGRDLFLASKIPPKNREWPALPGSRIRDVFPPDHIRASVAGMLRKVGGPPIDLVQFHVWQDEWADDAGWQGAVEALRRDGLVRHVGISVNRREPANVLRTLRTGLIDAVQVVYNVFDQSPEDELFPLCRELGVAVIARVPLDEGSLAGELTLRQPMAGRRLAQHVLHAGEPAGDRRAGRGAAAAGAGRAVDGPARAAVHPVEPGRDDRHPGDAAARAPGRQRRRGRGGTAAGRAADRAARASLGPGAVAGFAVVALCQGRAGNPPGCGLGDRVGGGFDTPPSHEPLPTHPGVETGILSPG